MIKHISEIAAAGSLILLLLTGVVAFDVQRAMAEHDEKLLAHPNISKTIYVLEIKQAVTHEKLVALSMSMGKIEADGKERGRKIDRILELVLVNN